MICTMSKHAARAKGCSDAIMMTTATSPRPTGANVFFVKDGEVHTPEPDCFLNGITRQTVLHMLKERGIRVIERHIEPHEMADFQQCWLTGTAAEVTPVGAIGPYSFEVGELHRRSPATTRSRLRPARDGARTERPGAVVTHRIIIDNHPGQDDAIAHPARAREPRSVPHPLGRNVRSRSPPATSSSFSSSPAGPRCRSMSAPPGRWCAIR